MERDDDAALTGNETGTSALLALDQRRVTLDQRRVTLDQRRVTLDQRRVTLDQRRVTLVDADDILAVRAADGEIYVPLRSMCAGLGIAPTGQVRRIRADDVMAEGLQEVRVQTPARGLQTMQCLRLDVVPFWTWCPFGRGALLDVVPFWTWCPFGRGALLDVVPFWLSGVEPSRVKEEARARLVAYKRWVVRRVWEAFAMETGLDQALTRPADTLEPIEALTLEQVARLGMAITNMARQQLAYERGLVEAQGQLAVQDAHLAAHDEQLAAQEERFDRAADVIRSVIHDVRAIQAHLNVGATITEAQAAEIALAVKNVGQRLATRGDREEYAKVYAEMYRRYRISSYKNLPATRYEEVQNWLHAWHQEFESERR